ncbi:MAG TPA: glycerol-3-phosphate 1-O-acyltransferase PlsY [Chloroflexota bacterium]|nr:glycerol-3-phosphate 1-O-acyltransferase PlsY [Chloroflexota bacterium]
MLVPWALSIVIAYLLGAIPSGLLIGKLGFGVDVREYGSRRTGATNVLRTLGKGAAALALALDLGKGILAVLVARWLLPTEPWAHVLAALAATAGHNWPIFTGFRGGRGVVVSTAAVAVLQVVVLAVLLPLAVFVIWRTRFVSLASILCAALAPPLMFICYLEGWAPLPYVVYTVIGAALLILSHRDNIGRLLAGTESRIGQGVPIRG